MEDSAAEDSAEAEDSAAEDSAEAEDSAAEDSAADSAAVANSAVKDSAEVEDSAAEDSAVDSAAVANSAEEAKDSAEEAKDSAEEAKDSAEAKAAEEATGNTPGRRQFSGQSCTASATSCLWCRSRPRERLSSLGRKSNAPRSFRERSRNTRDRTRPRLPHRKLVYSGISDPRGV